MELKPYPLCPKYLISREGEVYKTYKTRPMRRVSVLQEPRGYKCFFKQENNTSKRVLLHRALLMTFVRMPYDGEECSHIDGDPSNNSLSNLEWTTRKQNHAMKHIHGTAQVGGRNPHSKFTEDDVVNIRANLEAGIKGAAIARHFGVSESCISSIKCRVSWRHI